MKAPNVYAFMPARDEAHNLPACLNSLLNQTLKPFKITLINDASIDRTAEIAEAYGVQVINLTRRHESYSSPETGWMLATIWNHAFPPPAKTDYIFQTAPDAILPLDYIERLLALMERDFKLVVASGMIKGEKTLKSDVRGVGRLYKAWFWNKYIKKFPLIYLAESYPLYKALSLGLHIESFPELVIQPQRPTHLYKAKYGYGMRELGYFPPYALAKCFLSLLFSPKNGIMMFKTYLTSPFRPQPEYKTIHRCVRYHQMERMLHLKESLKIWLNRI